MDFHQNGSISTLHNLTDRPVEALEQELLGFAETRPMSLVLPSLFSELEGPALGNIIDELAQVPYLDNIIIGLDQADKDQFEYAKSYFGRLPQKHQILWNSGPRLMALDRELQDHQLSPDEPGKGRNVWFCFGYFLAGTKADVVGLHDCDILTYKRDLLARLMYPVANPKFPYVFSKGYYARVTEEKLNGRVVRLLISPLLAALKKVCEPSEYLVYLNSFRYALAGEFAMRRDTVKNIRIPSDWGLEIGVLSEIWRNNSVNAICQVEIADNYDHKHQPVSEDDPQKGLSKMSTDITKSIFRKLATHGHIFSAGTFRTIKATYLRTALDRIETYYNDAVINGLTLDRHAEEATVELFAANIMSAGEAFLDTPNERSFMPNWDRINSAIPDFSQRFVDAVRLDNEEAGLPL
ncbi:glycosyl transferase [Parasphingorhabdus sp.]|jgi:glucosyl-3-phosphoglycerate synthase|uniref:glycosyl transferase n=1 Tax=Parasphingorhabdus sp. TaxID=2709688 RepID=UPI0007F38135|nr:glycosyl transferase [Sphingomonadales bacterium EhC05]